MKKIIFGLYDKVAGMYGTPMFVPNVAVMLRSLTDELKRPRSENSQLFVTHPGDFALFEFGTFEESTGDFSVFDIDNVKLVCEVSTLVPKGDPIA